MKHYHIYSQNDPRWERELIGKSKLTVGSHGCLITCIAMACGKTPLEVLNTLEFTHDGLVLWSENEKNFEKLGLEFIARYDTFSTEKVKEYCESATCIPIIQVQTKSGGVHWVLPISRSLTWRGLGWATNDPWTGRREWKTVGLGAPYKRELGWVLLKRKLWT